MNRMTKKQKNRIIIMLVITLLCNFVMPNCIYAEDKDESTGGVIFKYGVPIMLMIPDLLITKLQQIFIADDSQIAVEDPKGGISYYSILYSPGVIFSGKVPGLDVNFISPMGDKDGRVEMKWYDYDYKQLEKDNDDIDTDYLIENYGLDLDKDGEGTSHSDILTYIFWFRTRYLLYNLGR